ncbi:MAG: alpha/beta hydrolase [Casimicrobium sp.]
MRKLIISVLTVVALAYLGICAYMFATQRTMQYRPNAAAMNPANVSLPQAKQETLATRDGERIVLWWIAPRDEKQPVFLYFHGNGANLENRAARFAKLTASGAGLMALSYRGYGGSSGSPTETAIRADARAAYDELVKRVSSKRIVLFGESLGTTVAVMLASEVEVAAVALDSSFDSAVDVASRAYPWLPVRLLLIDQFRADLAASRVRGPVKHFHCTIDPVTPLASAELLRTRFNNAAPIHLIEDRCHVPNFSRFEAALFDWMNTTVLPKLL